ncbi:MAG: energy-coupling factor ABC transporter permease [Clostridiales bacterium]|jgi:cobalt/nickel transport system permease protein|nr:energy-coupling factor ABC transporter permease [Clostridiales bacterium]
MHMSDVLLSPAVGGVMTAVGAGAIGYSAKKISRGPDAEANDKPIPMMAVMGAFVFAGQMVNFTIPGTGSSGHIGGGILLAALLGPFPALLTLAAVLLIQCLFFADGGLLAYGANVFNMGVCACLLAYPIVYKPLAKNGLNKKSITIASVAASVIGLQLGAFCVVLETVLSGVTELPFGAFALLMQPIHLAIGLVEGLVTAAVLCFVHSARPELLEGGTPPALGPNSAERKFRKTPALIAVLAAAALVIACGVSLLASAFPDGLEWSIENVTAADIQRSGGVYDAASGLVDATAFMPDYGFAGAEEGSALGTSAAGLIGSAITVIIAGGIGFIIHRVRNTRAKPAPGLGRH